MKSMLRLLTCNLLLWWCTSALADLVVIANPHSGIEKLSKDELVNLYMGRYRKLPSGVTVLPIDLGGRAGEKAHFYAMLVGKELPEINSYWARLMFSGQGSPPLQVESMDEVLDIVGSSKGAIGYIDRKKVDKRVKLVFDPSQ